jgi:subtilisin family serine protease
MANKKIIFQLKENVPIEKMGDIFSDLAESPRRLIDIQDKIGLLKLTDLSDSEAERVFTENIYPLLSDIEKDLYRIYITEVNEEIADDIIEKVDKSCNVDYVQYSQSYEIQFVPEAVSSIKNDGLTTIECADAWPHSTGECVIVAVIDSGVDYRHKLLEKKMWTDSKGNFGRDFIPGSHTPNDPIDNYGHGTHCAGIIGAAHDKSIVVSVAPGARIMALKIFDEPETGGATSDTEACVNAIKFATDNKAKVLSNSWTATDPDAADFALKKAIDLAYSQGCILIFAAGNQGHNIRCSFPANYEKVISVAATDRDDKLLKLSNYGDKVTISAPGDRILSLSQDTYTGTTEQSGTSTACPHVAGLVALIFEINKNFTFCQVKDILCDKGTTILTPRNRPLGERKRINAKDSVARAIELDISMRPCKSP